MIKLLRTIRLDPSDTFVFNRAAEPGEWAVGGAFMFAGRDVGALEGKARAAFRSGFVGVESLGFSTLVVVQEARDDERAAAVERLAAHFHAHFGAPDLGEARAAAEEEMNFAEALADHEPNTLLALHRLFEDGAIREAFRTLKRRAAAAGVDGLHAQSRAFTFHEVDGEDVDAADGIDEQVDLVGLMAAKREGAR